MPTLKKNPELGLFVFADPDNTGADTRWMMHVLASSLDAAKIQAIQEVAKRMNEDADDPIPGEIGAEIIQAIVGEDALDTNDDGLTLDAPWARLMLVKLVAEE